MGDVDIIAETARQIGVWSISSAKVNAILAAPKLAAPVMDEVDAALRRRAITAATLAEFGSMASADDVYRDVYIACRNARNGWIRAARRAA
ncbi:hypothetical protein [Aureimonas glaciei]|uniref:Uncharacterized protein n=1 Tax=Aureimonas glaciei TaxID=1776957 RepID=A0A917DK03_9HYPH|nr:hypothetical protein [Aureimonas glaciei]GGD43099.1 hypothetical protein GCM10011335_52190 [Aureimonas glaciei]